ncbi:MAG: 4Fe-4S binding protein [Candidatus Riflebacteria bacterium]|nr:4Fe-4S binding protein [Candidatus Riflebacteria bacterium]
MKRSIIKIDEEKCNGCGLCVPSCKEGAIKVIVGKARLISEIYCDGLGACLGECPQGAISIESREAEEFNEEAVKKHLTNSQNHEEQRNSHEEKTLPCGCPGSMAKSIERKKEVPGKENHPQLESSLNNWPVQLKLVPANAPYLKNASLLITADCVPFAYANFHQDFLNEKVVLIGCPKLDDIDFYQEKLVSIFKNSNPKSVTVLRMEVPCCAGIAHAALMARKESGLKFKLEIYTIGINGEIIDSGHYNNLSKIE